MPETSIQLEKVLGVPAYIWVSLEVEYRLIKANQTESKDAAKEVSLLPNFPYLELSKLNLVEKTSNALIKVQNLRRFFGVASLHNLAGVKEYSPAFRQNVNNKINHEALASWLRAGHLIANNVKTENFSKEKLISALPTIRSLTLEHEPSVMFEQLDAILKACGIALVVIPHFKKTHTTGATFWGNKNKAIIIMSLRGSWADIFWFSLFHELGHIILHDKRKTFLESGSTDPVWKKQEDEADYFAQKTLIPTKEFMKFKSLLDFSQSSIEAFSSTINIAPGIVTGRLQHEKLLPYSKHYGRIRYKWN